MSPTGYTADLYEGKDVSFEEFVLKCARAFGATITMRDDPIDKPIPDEFPASDYHARELEKAKTRLAEAKSWTEEQADVYAQTAYGKERAYVKEAREGSAAKRERYEAMLDKVLAWDAPPDAHQGLKNFMVQQLEESIRFDTDYEYPDPVLKTGEVFRAEAIAKAERDIAYHTKEDQEERERAAERTAWVRALRESLEEPVTA